MNGLHLAVLISWGNGDLDVPEVGIGTVSQYPLHDPGIQNTFEVFTGASNFFSPKHVYRKHEINTFDMLVEKHLKSKLEKVMCFLYNTLYMKWSAM